MTADLPPIVTEQPRDAPLVDALIDRAFGPGRYTKTAERLREGNHPLRDICFVARRGGAVVGCVRMWPIRIGETPAVLLGPFAVGDAWRSLGLGAALIRRACEAAATAGHALVLLVGDDPYYGPLGFRRAPRTVVLPGPVDAARVLICELGSGAATDLGGLVRPDP
ncbi:MAG TPA: N-acetyltransferase [Caulobacteraceae bacterium]|nr:N-acetyltransferase [Caulobacteraceae bacterium]